MTEPAPEPVSEPAKKSRVMMLTVGIAAAVIYGFLTWIFFDGDFARIAFFVAVPAALAAVTLAMSDEAVLRSYKSIVFIPWISIFTLFFMLRVLSIEDYICLVALAAPFIFIATLGAFLVRFLTLRANRKRETLLVFALLPFAVALVERELPRPTGDYGVKSTVVIAASPEEIWRNIVRVPRIRPEEMTPGFFHRIGIPRPVEARLTGDSLGGQRIGEFEGGLRFVERVTEWNPERRIAFNITIDPASIGNTAFHRHVLKKDDYFSFLDAAYDLRPLGDGRVELALTSRYRLTSTINFYSALWGDTILQDFQDRLLVVIKQRCENMP